MTRAFVSEEPRSTDSRKVYQIIKFYDLQSIIKFFESKYGVFVLEPIRGYVKLG